MSECPICGYAKFGNDEHDCIKNLKFESQCREDTIGDLRDRITELEITLKQAWFAIMEADKLDRDLIEPGMKYLRIAEEIMRVLTKEEEEDDNRCRTKTIRAYPQGRYTRAYRSQHGV